MSMSSSESLLKDEHTGLAQVRIWNTITKAGAASSVDVLSYLASSVHEAA